MGMSDIEPGVWVLLDSDGKSTRRCEVIWPMPEVARLSCYPDRDFMLLTTDGNKPNVFKRMWMRVKRLWNRPACALFNCNCHKDNALNLFEYNKKNVKSSRLKRMFGVE